MVIPIVFEVENKSEKNIDKIVHKDKFPFLVPVRNERALKSGSMCLYNYENAILSLASIDHGLSMTQIVVFQCI